MKIVRTTGVTRDQECAEKRAYTENIITLDARLLQDIISGRWTRQQLYEPTPTWYHEAASIMLPLHGKVDLENMKLLLETKDQLRLMVVNPDYSL